MGQMKNSKPIINEDSWDNLKNITKARIALGNVGGSLPLREVLDFKLAHALAKDAIYSELDIENIRIELEEFKVPVFELHSQVKNRDQYLKRPDLGRRLDEKSSAILKESAQDFDIVFVISDGLSADAVNNHASKILHIVLPELLPKYKIAIALTEQGRVAVGDEIGELLNSDFTAVFIGERPGLSSPESMGIYTTYKPARGLTDERRNCISNIHYDGMSYSNASAILFYLIEQSFLRKTSGISIKIELNDLTPSPISLKE